MNISKIVFLAIFLLVCSIMLTVISLTSKLNILPFQDVLSEYDLQQKALEESYQKELTGLLEYYTDASSSLNDIDDNLMSLTVPNKYQDLHFKLITALEDDNVDLTKEKLSEVVKDYTWLSSILSLFIINNF